MKKYIIFLLIFISCNANAQDILGTGDSIALGYPGTTGAWPELALNLGGLTYYNDGVGGNNITDVNSRIAARLTSVQPDYVYLVVGSNDARWKGPVLATYITTLSSVLSKCQTAGAELIVNQITPILNLNDCTYGTCEAGQEGEKLYNAAIEKFCFENSIKCAPTYQAMAHNDPDYEDDPEPTYTTDGCHMSTAGNTRLAELMAAAAIPDQKRVFGDTQYPTMGHESWSWWLLSGSASIIGDADTGTLSLPVGGHGVSQVLCIDSAGNEIAIYCNNTDVTIKYRTAANNFDRDNAVISWVDYSSPFTITNQFVQIWAGNDTAATITVTDATLDWTGTYTPDPPDSPVEPVTYGIGLSGVAF